MTFKKIVLCFAKAFSILLGGVAVTAAGFYIGEALQPDGHNNELLPILLAYALLFVYVLALVAWAAHGSPRRTVIPEGQFDREQAEIVVQRQQRFFDLALAHSRQSFWLCAAGLLMGFASLAVAAFLYFKGGAGGHVEASAIPAVGGAFAEFISAGFFVLHQRAVERAARIETQLDGASRLLFSLRQVEHLAEPSRKWVRGQLIALNLTAEVEDRARRDDLRADLIRTIQNGLPDVAPAQ